MPPKKILVVDDQLMNYELVEDILKPLGYDLKYAANGELGMELAQGFKPDLILLDIVMPKMSGLELQVLLKDNELTKKIPVLFLTGQDSLEFNLRAMEHGAVGFIEKPLDPKRLVRKIESLFEAR